MIGIIGAMQEEIIELKELMTEVEEFEIARIIYYKGRLENKDVVLVEGGIGKVNSSVCTTILIEKFNVEKVIFTGVAGGIGKNIEVGDIVISSDLVQHDFDLTAFGRKVGDIPRMEIGTLKGDETLINLAKESALKIFDENQVRVGRILSGDQFINNVEKLKYLEETFSAEAVEMEGASVAQVCYLFNTPFVIIRAISDKAGSDAEIDFKSFIELAAKNSKKIVINMLKSL